MKTIKFYTDTGKFIAWKKWKSCQENYLELRSWILSGNSLVVKGKAISTMQGLKSIVR